MSRIPTAEEASYCRLLLREGVVHLAVHPRALPWLQYRVNPYGEAWARNNHQANRGSYQPFAEEAEQWGFGGALRSSPPTPEGWLCYQISPSDELLRSGKGYHDERYAQAVRLAASFNLVCDSLRSVRVVESSGLDEVLLEDVQLVSVIGFGPHGLGWPMAAAAAHTLMVWLSQLQLRNPSAFAELERQICLAMYDMYLRLWPDTRRYERPSSFHLVFDPVPHRRLVLSVPGDACDLGGLDDHRPEENRLRLNCHNLDSPVQAYALLAGLAKLDELAWQDFGR